MINRKPLPTLEYLHSLFLYEPETGLLRWKVSRCAQRRIGDAAGWNTDTWYVQIRIDRQIYTAHSIIWKMVTGEDPSELIDHKNGVKNDNRWDNLREASLSENQANSGIRRHNQSGAKGVSKSRNLWEARICFHGKHVRLGRYATKEEAHSAYRKAAAETHGEFARFE